MKNRIVLTLSVILVVFLISGCVAGQGSSQQGVINLEDGLGRQVMLTGPAQRIVSLSPSVTEILFAIDDKHRRACLDHRRRHALGDAARRAGDDCCLSAEIHCNSFPVALGQSNQAPPLTVTTLPVAKLPSSPARNATAAAISSGWASRFITPSSATACFTSSGRPA